MNSSYNNQESRMKLKSLKEFKDGNKSKVDYAAISKRKTSYLTEWNRRKGSQYLSNVIKSMKVNNLVKLFVYKLRRNIARNNDQAYNMIQDTMEKRKSQPNLIRSFHLNEHLQAIIISLDIICILIIQTLSTFHGFYQDYIQRDSTSLSIVLIEIFCLFIFLLKLIMGFTTPRLTHGQKNQFMKYVALEYVTSIIFVFNLLNFVMTIFKVVIPQNKPVGIVSFIISVLSMPVLTQDLQIVEATWINNFTKKQYFTMFKVLLFNVFFVQFISTMFIAVSYFDQEENWIQKAIRTGVMKPNLSWWQQYFYALYWAIVTSATIGFGDLTPANYLQTGFMCILMILGTVVLSFNVSSIGHIVENLRSIDEQRKQETMIFKRICKDEKISKGLQNKISDYIYKSAQLKAQYDFNQRKMFLDKLPPQLRNQLQSQYAQNIFSKIPFFRQLSHQTLVNFSLKLKGQIYYPGQQLLISQGKLTKIIFLKHGKIGMAYNRFGSKLNGLILQNRQVNKDSDTPFLLNKNLLSRTRKLNYRISSTTYSVMLQLEYDDFYEIIRRNRKDYELFFETSNSMSEIDEQWQLFVCTLCAPKKHSAFFCPRLHYIPYKSLVIDRYLFCPSMGQPAFRDYLRKQNRLKRKSSRLYWKTIFKQYQKKWEISHYKEMTKRSKNLSKEQLQNNEVSPTTFTDKYIASSKNINLPSLSDKNINQELIIRLSQKILKMHCCELAKVDKLDEPIGMDVMHNFKNFFPRFNPSQLFKLSLKSTKRQIITYNGPATGDLNQYEINLKI